MCDINDKRNRRILVIDDNEAIHEDFRIILSDEKVDTSNLERVEAAIFGRKTNNIEQCDFQIDSAFQGQEGLEKVKESLRDNRPYAVAFVDVQMPPGWDGIETIQKIWREDSNIQIVICTAYSDYSWHDVVDKLGQTDQFLILKKPFDSIEVRQLACSLTEKWHLLNQLDNVVKQRTYELDQRIKELDCLYGISAVVEKPNNSLDNMLGQIVDLILSGFRHPDLTCAKIVLADREFCSKNYNQTRFKQSVDILVGGNKVGSIEVSHLEKNRQSEDQMFTKDEMSLLEAVGKQLGRIAERKLAEEALEHVNISLEEALEKLTASNHELIEFVHVAAHDLKSPLRTIGCLAGIVVKDFGDKIDTEGREQLDLIVARAERMSERIDKILRYSEIGRVKTAAKKVDLNVVLEKVMSETVHSENLEIVVENDLPELFCQEDRVAEIFYHLLNNSARHMDKPKGRIKISCEQDGNFWKFSVTDNGPGIDRKYHEKIFEIFQTLSSDSEFGNSGIGLSIVKKIVEMFGGKVWLKSEVGVGTTFYFTLPKQRVGSLDNEKL